MKTIRSIYVVVIVTMLSILSPLNSSAADKTAPVTETPEQKVSRLQQRIEEIKGMDKSELSRAERKALRKEVRQIKEEVKAVSGGVYISIGALLLAIILLLVLL